jgi:hypothetical protein
MKIHQDYAVIEIQSAEFGDFVLLHSVRGEVLTERAKFLSDVEGKSILSREYLSA